MVGKAHTERPASIRDLLQRQLVDRQVPAINLDWLNGSVTPIDVLALIRRLESVERLGSEFLYYRLDMATNVDVRWAYLVNGSYEQAGRLTRRFGGRPVLRNLEPRQADPRLQPGEPGWVAVNTDTITLRIDSREVEQHLPHVWAFASRVFRNGGTQAVRNVLESLASQARQAEYDRDGYYRDFNSVSRELENERRRTDANDGEWRN